MYEGSLLLKRPAKCQRFFNILPNSARIIAAASTTMRIMKTTPVLAVRQLDRHCKQALPLIQPVSNYLLTRNRVNAADAGGEALSEDASVFAQA